MISAEAPVLFAKAAQIFITELTLRAWIHTEDNKRRTLQVRHTLELYELIFLFASCVCSHEHVRMQRSHTSNPLEVSSSVKFFLPLVTLKAQPDGHQWPTFPSGAILLVLLSQSWIRWTLERREGKRKQGTWWTDGNSCENQARACLTWMSRKGEL